MKSRLMNILSAWEDWGIYSTSYLLGLEAAFLYNVYFNYYQPSLDLIEHKSDLHIEDFNNTKLISECIKNGISIESISSEELIKKLNRNISYENRKYHLNNNEYNDNGNEEKYDVMSSFNQNGKASNKSVKKAGQWVEMTGDEVFLLFLG